MKFIGTKLFGVGCWNFGVMFFKHILMAEIQEFLWFSFFSSSWSFFGYDKHDNPWVFVQWVHFWMILNNLKIQHICEIYREKTIWSWVLKFCNYVFQTYFYGRNSAFFVIFIFLVFLIIFYCRKTRKSWKIVLWVHFLCVFEGYF